MDAVIPAQLLVYAVVIALPVLIVALVVTARSARREGMERPPDDDDR